jgi:ClpP class serine protease
MFCNDLFLFQRLIGEPLALSAGAARMLALDMSRGIDARAAVANRAPRIRTADPDIVGGVAVIPVSGFLASKFEYATCAITGYDVIAARFRAALASPDVAAIALDVDSEGGEAAGCFDLADEIRAARGIKPVWAILSQSATSAAYAIASAADRVCVPRTGSTGGVGLLLLHLDSSRALDGAGIRLNPIVFGSRKLDGVPFLPLDPAAKARFQRQLDVIGGTFADTVARNRRLKPAAVRDMEGATFLGERGVRAGLADAIAGPREAFAELLDMVRRRGRRASESSTRSASVARHARASAVPGAQMRSGALPATRFWRR